MKNILVIGGGKIGSVVADLLVQTPEATGYRVTVADRSAEQLDDIARDSKQSTRLTTLLLDVNDAAALRDLLFSWWEERFLQAHAGAPAIESK